LPHPFGCGSVQATSPVAATCPVTGPDDVEGNSEPDVAPVTRYPPDTAASGMAWVPLTVSVQRTLPLAAFRPMYPLKDVATGPGGCVRAGPVKHAPVRNLGSGF
jgi:hypothetical protein